MVRGRCCREGQAGNFQHSLVAMLANQRTGKGDQKNQGGTNLPLETRRVKTRPAHPSTLLGRKDVEDGQLARRVGRGRSPRQVVGRVDGQGHTLEEVRDGRRDGEQACRGRRSPCGFGHGGGGGRGTGGGAGRGGGAGERLPGSWLAQCRAARTGRRSQICRRPVCSPARMMGRGGGWAQRRKGRGGEGKVARRMEA